MHGTRFERSSGWHIDGSFDVGGEWLAASLVPRSTAPDRRMSADTRPGLKLIYTVAAGLGAC
jgi:hypothetical protein